MTSSKYAQAPEDLVRLFVEFANAGDVESLVGLYEEDAVLAVGPPVAGGREAIRAFYSDLLARKSEFPEVEPSSIIQNGDLALTVTITGQGRCSVEVARRQSDGTWRWLIDQLKVKTLTDSRPVSRGEPGKAQG
jgi:ketosteroid isomerase-like protein